MEFSYLCKRNEVDGFGKLNIKVVPTNAGSILQFETPYKTYYTSKTFQNPKIKKLSKTENFYCKCEPKNKT